MSKINVDTWEPESGTAATLMATGDTVTVPSGASLVVASGATINITGATQTGFPSAGFSDVDSDTTSGSETYTVPADITKLLVFITGAGGGGGAGGVAINGTGGHAATTVIARVTVVAADTITIAIGAGGVAGIVGGDRAGQDGGNSTFTHATGSGSGSMSTITAPGGKGALDTTTTQPVPVAGTIGANNEGISILGGYGVPSFPNSQMPGHGGAGFWGGGGRGALFGITNPAADGTSYGSGGGGGSSTSSYQTPGAGAVGICFIMEFK